MGLLPKTWLCLKRGETRTFGPVPISDAARSIYLDVDGSGQFTVELNVTDKQGQHLWGGSVGALGGKGYCRIGAGSVRNHWDALTRKLVSTAVYFRDQVGLITITALTDFEGFVYATNSITIGTPAANDAFGQSVSVSVDAGSGSNRVLAAGIWHNSSTLSTFTYNSLDLTAVSGAIATSGAANAIIYRYIAPATGSHTLAATTSSDTSIGIAGIPLDGVDQTTPAENGTGATGSASPATVNVTSATDNLVIDVMRVSLGSAGSITAGGGQTEHVNRTFSSDIWGMSSEAGASSVTMSWTISGTINNTLIAAASFKVYAPSEYVKTGAGVMGAVGSGSKELPKFGTGTAAVGMVGLCVRNMIYVETGAGRIGMVGIGTRTEGIIHVKYNRYGSIKLAWDASVTPGVLGYRVYWGFASGNYQGVPGGIDVGNVLAYTVTNLPRGLLYFAVTAYNAAGESGFSNEISDNIVVGTVLSARGARQRDFLKAGAGILGLTAQGAKFVVVSATKTGAGVAGFTAVSFDYVERNETAAGISGFVGSGADANIFTDKGTGVAGWIGSGESNQDAPSLFVKSGEGVMGFAGSGDYESVFVEAGTGIMGLTAGGTKTVISTPTTVGFAKRRKRSESRSLVLSMSEDR